MNVSKVLRCRLSGSCRGHTQRRTMTTLIAHGKYSGRYYAAEHVFHLDFMPQTNGNRTMPACKPVVPTVLRSVSGQAPASMRQRFKYPLRHVECDGSANTRRDDSATKFLVSTNFYAQRRPAWCPQRRCNSALPDAGQRSRVLQAARAEAPRTTGSDDWR